MEKEYKVHYVAFLDILGFKEMISNTDYHKIYNVFEKLLSFDPAERYYQVFKHIKKRIMSDSIILFIDYEVKDALQALIEFCCYIQVSLMCMDDPVLVRGGIAKGELYFNDDKEIVFGKGLTAAYNLENGCAKYPRIIFTGNLLAESKENVGELYADRYLEKDFKKDDDGYYFVSFLTSSQVIDVTEKNESVIIKDLDEFWKKYIAYWEKIRDLCDNILNSNINLSVREKYQWLLKQIDDIEKTNSHYKEYRKKINSEIDLKNKNKLQEIMTLKFKERYGLNE